MGEIMTDADRALPTGFTFSGWFVCLNHWPEKSNTAAAHLWLLGQGSATLCPSALLDRLDVLCSPALP